MAIAALAILLLGALAAWLISRQITSPLREMALAAQNMSTGDYSRRVHVARNDELGMLSDWFNSMARQVEDSHRNLESKVAARTKELAATVAILTGNASVDGAVRAMREKGDYLVKPAEPDQVVGTVERNGEEWHRRRTR